jgi:hypothetical protein
MASIPSLHETRPTRGQRLAMEKMLHSLLGANEFYRLCAAIEVGAVNGDILKIFAPAKICVEIKLRHLDDFAAAAEYAFGRPIRMVNILPADFGFRDIEIRLTRFAGVEQ